MKTPDGRPQVRHNVKLPPIKAPKKNPNPVPTSKTVTLRNSGDATLDGLIGMPGTGEPFLCTAGCVPFSLPPGAATTFTLAFAPTSKGNYKDQLTLSSDSSRKPSVTVKMHGSAKQGVPGGTGGIGGGGTPPPPLNSCDIPVGVAQNGSGGALSPVASSAETLLDTLTATSNGVLPALSQFAGSTATGQQLSDLPVLGAISTSPGGALSGLTTSGSTAPTLGSLVPDPSSIPVLGSMVDSVGGAACQQFNSVIAVTGPCGQMVGVLLAVGTSPLDSSDVAALEAPLDQFVNNFGSAAGLEQLISNPAQISGFLTRAQSDLSALGGSLTPQLSGGLNQCSQALPSVCSPANSTVSQLESLAPTTPGNVAPTLEQLAGSLPAGGSLATIPVIGAIATGGTAPQLLPVSLPAPNLGSLAGGTGSLPSIPVLGSIPLSPDANQVDALVAVLGGAQSQVMGVIPVLGSSGAVPSPATIISMLQGGACSGLGPVSSQITQTLTSPALSSPLTGQISGVPNLSSALSSITMQLQPLLPGLGSTL